MEKYKIYCTEAQTRKALSLGAPIEGINGEVSKKNDWLEIPTTQQLIGWLEEQGIAIDVTVASKKIYFYSIHNIDDKGSFGFTGRCEDDYKTRREATLAAIDSALAYLATK